METYKKELERISAILENYYTAKFTSRKKEYKANKINKDQIGQLLIRVSFSDKNSAQKFEDLHYDIHLGLILGIPGKIIVFIASLLSVSLPVTGFLIWYK